MHSPAPKPIILSVYCKHKAGGFTQRLYRAWQAIAAADYELVYLATHELPVKHVGIRAVILPMRSSERSPLYWPEFYLRAVLMLRRLSQQHQVQAHFIFSCFYASISILSTLRLSTKTITLVRGDDVFDARYKSYPYLRRSVHRALEKIAVNFSSAVLATSISMQQAMQRRNPHAPPIGVLSNDITTPALAIRLPDKTQPLKIATVSVLNERKNIALALKALAQLKHLDWEYLLIGPDTSGKNHAQELQQLCVAYGIADRVQFLGWRSDAATLLRDCHLFVFPTLMEGSPNALMEAMGYGLPCLASRIPEVTEVLTAPLLHFDPHDPMELAQKISDFITDPANARQVTQQTARDKQRYQFDWEQRITALLADENTRDKPVAPKPRAAPSA